MSKQVRVKLNPVMNACKSSFFLLKVSRVRTMYLRTILFLSILLTVPNVHAQVQMETRVDTTQGYIGDLFTLTLNVQHSKGFTVGYPDDLQTLGEFSVRDVHAETRPTQSIIRFTLTVFDTGEYEIPPVEIAVQPPDTAQEPLMFKSDPVEINIVSLVPADAQDLKDIKPLMDLPTQIPWLWIILSLILILIALALWIYFRKRTKKEEPEMTPEERRQSAHERAYKQLDRIRAAEYPRYGAMKEHFSEISQTIRAYFEDRYFINALEMTTREVMRNLPSGKLNRELEERIEHLLSLSDLVKFAKYKSSDKEAEESLESAYAIVDETKLISYEYEENKEEAELLVENRGDTP